MQLRKLAPLALAASVAGCNHSASSSTPPLATIAPPVSSAPSAPTAPATPPATTPPAAGNATAAAHPSVQPVATKASSTSSAATPPSAASTPSAAPPASASSKPSTGQTVAAAAVALFGGLLAQAQQQQKVADLGQALFHDKLLSGNRDISCSTCHHHAAGLSDGLSLSIGTGGVGVGPTRQRGTGAFLPRRSPTLFDTGSSSYGGSSQSFFWDARVTFSPLKTPDPELVKNPSQAEYARIQKQLSSPLAAQALFPLLEPAEMRGAPGTNEIADAPDNLTAWRRIMARLIGTNNGIVGGIQQYRDLFARAYPGVAFDDMNIGHATQAIATFVGLRLSTSDSPYDDYVNNSNASALSPTEWNGMNLFFGKAKCDRCHSGTSFSDFQAHGLAVPQLGPGKVDPSDDRGIALATGSRADDYKFRTPSLRNVALSGAWMHDGCFTTLEAAVRHHLDPKTSFQRYSPAQLRPDVAATLDSDPTRNGARLAALDPALAQPIALTDPEVHDLVAFLGALTDRSAAQNARAARPRSVPSGLPVD